MTDWLWVLKNSVWLNGMAAAIAGLSWADFVSVRSSRQLGTVVKEPSISLWLVAAWALVSGGLYSAANTVKEGVLSLARLCALSIAALALHWAVRKVTTWMAVPSLIKRLAARWPVPWLEKAAW
ncbi:MAG: hypothetical protein AMJ93_14560, partial [Anaerolineae bacterium SM23_84]